MSGYVASSFETAKKEGDNLFRQGKFLDASNAYNMAIFGEGKNEKLYANRAACWEKLIHETRAKICPNSGVGAGFHDHGDGTYHITGGDCRNWIQRGLEDSRQCVKLKPTWARGWQRLSTFGELAAFHEDTVDRDEAMAECETACRAALALEPGGANAQKCRRTLQMLRDDAEYVPVPAGDLPAHCAGDDALLCRDTAAKHKAAGGGDFSLSDFAGAAKHYSTALAFDWTDHVLYSNRSACLAALKEYDGALRDGRRCVRLQPDWPKGHGRCAAALLGKGDVPGAQAAAERGLELDATNANLIAVRDACLARCLEDAAIGA